MTTAEPRFDGFDRSQAVGATGLLGAFNRAGIVGVADVHVARRFGEILKESDEQVQLALALTVAATRAGSVCLDLSQAATIFQPESESGDDAAVKQVAWQQPSAWVQQVAKSAFVTAGVMRLEGTTVYLDRYWREESQVSDDLVRRLAASAPSVDLTQLEAGLERVLPGQTFAEQRDAVRLAAGQLTTILVGGPGTGKTTTVAGLLALLSEQIETQTGVRPQIALCAPTGKASARLQEAIDEATANFQDPKDRDRVAKLEAQTMHRLLGPRGKSNRFRHDRTNRLPHDVIVVDEASMMPLTMMARLMEAIRDDTRLVFVGDADQLSSVEAGAVLADLVAGLHGVHPSPVASLRTTHRYGAQIGALAQALRDSDADQVIEILSAGQLEVQWIKPDDSAALESLKHDLATNAFQMRVAAERGEVTEALALLGKQRLLCAHREGAHGVGGWNRLIERLVSERSGVATYDEWYAGRPVLLTKNDSVLKLRNGDMGITYRRDDGSLRVALDEMDRREFAPTRLVGAETTHAMTVHKSQGSQAEVVTVIMPPPESRLLTRELFYTAITRAKEQVRIVGDEASIRAAVGREVRRATGLAARLSRALDKRQ
ncbi:MAG: exodeoxyribonuclease V subunit alpha [Nocardioidaceae bacterium]